jgi:hypothetical protein
MEQVELEDVKQWISIRQNREDSESGRQFGSF